MSRCKACDSPLTNNDTPSWNKVAHREEDLCGACRSLVYNSYIEHEYVCGRYPTDGAKSLKNLKE